MNTQRRILSIASCGLVLVSISAARFASAEPHGPVSTQEQKDACNLLAAGDASTALEVKSLPGRHTLESNPGLCVWSDDPKGGDTSRRVVLVIVSQAQFKIAGRGTVPTIKIEPVGGVGDEAFYQIYPGNASPFIWVRKGNSAFSIRILASLKPKPFTIDQEKSKELVLAKAAAAKL